MDPVILFGGIIIIGLTVIFISILVKVLTSKTEENESDDPDIEGFS